jgi:hypothetical protein
VRHSRTSNPSALVVSQPPQRSGTGLLCGTSEPTLAGGSLGVKNHQSGLKAPTLLNEKAIAIEAQAPDPADA